MTSSIYPILASLSAPIITAPGAAYTTTPTVTIDAPSNGPTATGTAVIASGVINAIITLVSGSGYAEGEEVTLAGSLTGIGAIGIATISGGGAVTAIVFTSRGSGFVPTEVVTITGVNSGANNATFTVSTVAANAVSSITLTNGGTNYTILPAITITGGGGAGATATAVFSVKSGTVAATTNILISSIPITRDQVKPGGGGILRLYFAFTFGTSPATVTVFNNGTAKGNLNSDNLSQVVTDGYYRFDIDVEEGDNINLQASESITAATFVRAHLVQFGA